MNQLVSPFRALNELHRELNRVFDERTPYRADPVFAEQSNWIPQVDIKEDESGYAVIVDVPGIDPGDVEITLHNNVLTIRGERSETKEDKTLKRRERVSGTFQRQFTLPDSVDENGVKASASNGVLEISIPRIAEAKPLSITVEGE
jgi:HSP20 family protein